MPRKELRLEDLTFLIDTREQRPLDFNWNPDTQKKVRTERATLDTGDYTVKGLEKRICVERKSLNDLLTCIGRERDRFEREIDRMMAFECCLIVVEASWDEIELGMWRSRLNARQVMGSIQGWYRRRVPFFFHPNRNTIANFVGNMMFLHAKHCFNSLVEMLPGLRVSDGE